MSEESTTVDLVELVRQTNEAANRGDFDAAIGYFSPDVVWDTSRDGFGTFEGAAATRRFWEDWVRGYEELEQVLEELLDMGNGVVFAVVRQKARLVGGTGYIRRRGGWVYVWADSLCASVTVYPDTDIDEARAAAQRLAKERGKAVSRNAGTVRELIDTFNAFHRGEVSSEAFAENYDPQIEIIWRDRQTYPDVPQQLRGIPECIAMNELYRERWIDMAQEAVELIEAPGDRVLALTRQSGRGRQSGVPLVIHFFSVFTIRDAKVSKLEFFRHRADAVRAIGLKE
jgi:ketosteroid isomerase-like protein